MLSTEIRCCWHQRGQEAVDIDNHRMAKITRQKVNISVLGTYSMGSLDHVNIMFECHGDELIDRR